MRIEYMATYAERKNKLIIAALGIITAALAVLLGVKVFAVAALCALAVLVLLVKYETATYILCLYVFIDYFARKYSAYGSWWDKLFFVLLIGLWGYKWLLNGKDKIRTTPVDGALILFYGVALVVFFANTHNFALAFEGMRAAIQHTFWYFAAVQLIKDRKNANNMYRLLVFAGAILALHGIYQYIIGVTMPSNWVDSLEVGLRTRVYSIIGSPNILASLMTLLCPMSVALFFAEKRAFNKFVYFGAAGLMALCLVFTFSRGAWIGFLIAMGVYVFVKDKRLIIPAAFVVLLAALLVPSVTNRLTYMLSEEYIQSSLRAGRLVRWIEGLQIVMARPFLGMGHGMFGGAVAVNNEVKDVFYMDNYYLKTAVEMGLLGLAAFVYLMYTALVWAYRCASQLKDDYYKELSIGAFAGLLGVSSHNLVENVFEVPMMVSYFWVIMAIVMCFYMTSEKETR